MAVVVFLEVVFEHLVLHFISMEVELTFGGLDGLEFLE